jgi:ectoine hydroxylase-related dioxygenase (phytanoyl-CoA dioxygenase family)
VARWSVDEVSVDDLRAVLAEGARMPGPALADDVQFGVPVYDCNDFADHPGAHVEALQEEWASVLAEGAGIVVMHRAMNDAAVVDRVTAAFFALIEAERVDGRVAGDHFATPGANDRVWNAHEKLARAEPGAFAEYYASPVIAAICTAWLGPAYQITTQVNVVNPGGAAQMPHADYHLGFLSGEQAASYPTHVHALSPALTLQGAIAHCDMPVETGPTMYLPHSQKYPLVYLAWRHPAVIEYFDRHHVQLPLQQGDAVFFNPALLHGAGTNRTTDVRRIANLLQVSSAFGRAMETLDRAGMSSALFPSLLSMADADAADRVIAAAAEGYAFPTDLDRDQPIDGLAPPSQADVLRCAVRERWSADRLADALAAHGARRAT